MGIPHDDSVKCFPTVRLPGWIVSAAEQNSPHAGSFQFDRGYGTLTRTNATADALLFIHPCNIFTKADSLHRARLSADTAACAICILNPGDMGRVGLHGRASQIINLKGSTAAFTTVADGVFFILDILFDMKSLVYQTVFPGFIHDLQCLFPGCRPAELVFDDEFSRLTEEETVFPFVGNRTGLAQKIFFMTAIAGGYRYRIKSVDDRLDIFKR